MREVTNVKKEFLHGYKGAGRGSAAGSTNPAWRGIQVGAPPALFRERLVLAFAIATLADGSSVFLTLTPSVQWAVDLVTAILLFMVLGRQWILLPGLIMEAIPGLYVFPFWVLVVGTVAVWGKARP
jgi:hypothetical protein